MASVVQSTSNSKEYFTSSELAIFLKPLDNALRCHICFDYFTNSMMTKCCHNYCSFCIRKYMSYKTQCPTCFQDASEPELQNNRLLDEILQIYKTLRNMLQLPVESFNDCDVKYSVASDITMTIKCENLNESLSSDSQSNDSSSKRSSSDMEVPCPVCSAFVLSDRINIHLDNCLKRSNDRSERKTLSKLVYHLLSDKELKKKLKEHGLSTSGNRQALIKRHKNFILFYNANCDALNPKPVDEILLEVEKQELEERVNSSQCGRNTSINKRSDPELIERENESYIKEHQNQYKSLMKDVHLRTGRFIKRQISSDDSSISNSQEEPEKSSDGCTFKIETFATSFMKQELTDMPEDNSITGSNRTDSPAPSLDDFELSQVVSQRKQPPRRKKKSLKK